MNRVIGVECWADSYFFGRLLKNKGLIRKEKNKTDVLKSLTERAKNTFSIGIVDKDKSELNTYFKEGRVEDVICIDGFTEVAKLKDEKHFVIQLCPNEFEDWIIEFLKNCKKTIADFGYEDIHEFKKDSKVILERILSNQKFLAVINYALDEFEKSDNHILNLKRVLEYLIDKNYSADLKEFKNA